MSTLAKLKRGIEAFTDAWTQPEEFTKGEEFEKYVRGTLFPPTAYTLLAWTRQYHDNKNYYDEASKNPDLKFRIPKTNTEFFVEAKFRKGLFKGGINWCKPYQLNRYKAIDKTTKVLVVIGYGGDPDRPERGYLIPVQKIPYGYTTLYSSVLKGYEISLRESVNPRRVQALVTDV